MANRLDFKTELPTSLEISGMFDAIPLFKKNAVLSKTTRAAARIILRRAKELTPRGKPENRRKRSKKQRASANWDVQLHTTIDMVTRRTDRSAFAIVGPRHPEGNKAWFNSPKSGSRKHVLWGHDTGRTFRSVRNWIAQGFDETKTEQMAAMRKVLRKELDEHWGYRA